MQGNRARLSKACCSPAKFAALEGALRPVPVDCATASEVRWPCPARSCSTNGHVSGTEHDYVLANPPLNDSDWRGELLKALRPRAHQAPGPWRQERTHQLPQHLGPRAQRGIWGRSQPQRVASISLPSSCCEGGS